jgi:hypothetical protein
MELTAILGDSKAVRSSWIVPIRWLAAAINGAIVTTVRKAMKRLVVLTVLIIGGIILPSTGPIAAADDTALRNVPWRYTLHREELPFRRSKRAQSVWASGACWSECGSHCAWGQTGCLQHDGQGRCLKLTDACDRYCQRECRTNGGPLLPIDFFWE